MVSPRSILARRAALRTEAASPQRAYSLRPMHRILNIAIALLLYSFATSAQAAEDEARLWLTGISHVALPAEIKGSLLVQARFFG